MGKDKTVKTTDDHRCRPDAVRATVRLAPMLRSWDT